MEHRAHEGNDLNSLPEAHVIAENSTGVTDVVLIEKPHPLLLVVPQISVDRGWDLNMDECNETTCTFTIDN